MRANPHILGIDDGSFDKKHSEEVPVVAVMMEGSTLVEGVAVNSFPVDGKDATDFLEQWITTMRWFESLQGIVTGGITIAGLGIIDIRQLSTSLDKAVISVTREETGDEDLINALHSADLQERSDIVRGSPPSQKIQDGLYISFAGIEYVEARQLIRSSLLKSTMPEPLRLAHLIGAALATGESRGRV